MKKKFSFALVFGALGTLFGTTSCVKDWKCECTYDGGSDSVTFPNTKRSDAKKKCDAYENLLKAYDSSASCKIK